MYFIVFTFTFLLYYTNGEETTNLIGKIPLNNISDNLFNILQVKCNDRLKELKEKLKSVDKYVINSDFINDILINVTKETNLSEINFFKALNEEDHFRLISQNEPKSLYLKLKENINRDDVLSILKKTGAKNDIVKTARKDMGASDDYFGKDDDEILGEVMDKMIAEAPSDDHNFSMSIKDSMYWDPQNELEDLRDHHQHDGRRIYKGEKTSIRSYPFMVSIHVMGRFWCGGSIYWHDLVLTSASCLQLLHNNRFFRENPRVLKVRVGSNHSRIGGELVDALEVYFHPGYSPKTLRNNIAIIRLRHHLAFGKHRTPKVITISHSSFPMPANTEVGLLGWGVTKVSQKMSYEPVFIQRKFLPVYPNNFCKEVYGDKFITETMFCAGTMTTGEGACDHDAGGPAISSGRLYGIISFGPSICGFPNAPTVFTLVGAFADWAETINETMPPYYRGKQRTTTTTQSPLLELLENWRGRPVMASQMDKLAVSTDLPPSTPAPIKPEDMERLENT